MRLTDYGRRQAFMVNQMYQPHSGLIHHVHSSDLQRCIDTTFYALGFPAYENAIN